MSEIETIREALLVLRDGSLTQSMANNAPPALEALDVLAARLEKADNRHADALEQIKRLIDQRDALAARLEATEQALREIAKDDQLVSANEDAFSIHAYRRCREIAKFALARQPSQEQPVPCDQHDAGHQAGWA
jgi:DNA repair exonuclease SbcCD ATPase subunit